MAAYEIPLRPNPQTMTVALGAAVYKLNFQYADTQDGGWFMDIGDVAGVPIVSGIPLVTGADLLEQYAYLGLGGRLFVRTDGAIGNNDAAPDYADLGVASHLYWQDAP